ncbi:MAG TPA: hypothetical protein EYG73_10560, partial [Arcobacter sp.]|nr:hypothetical protein [Arcobacter sp.]
MTNTTENTLNMTAEDFGLSDTTSFTDVVSLHPKYKIEPKRFAGFSKITQPIDNSMEFTTKHAELYICQLAYKKGIIEAEEAPKNTRKFDRIGLLDQLSIELGFEINTLRN